MDTENENGIWDPKRIPINIVTTRNNMNTEEDMEAEVYHSLFDSFFPSLLNLFFLPLYVSCSQWVVIGY